MPMEESSSNTPDPAPDIPEDQAVRYYNDAVIALDLLYDVALASEGALEELRAEAERLIERGAHWLDLKYTKVKE
jgi:hypothetical protein